MTNSNHTTLAQLKEDVCPMEVESQVTRPVSRVKVDEPHRNGTWPVLYFILVPQPTSFQVLAVFLSLFVFLIVVFFLFVGYYPIDFAY